MAHRRCFATATALAVVLIVTACGEEGGPSTTDVPDTSSSTTPSSTAPPSTTTTSTTTPPPACDAGELPDGLDEIAWVLVDADGDGDEDRLVAYRDGDVARLRLEPASGGSVETEMLEPPGPLPVEPIGGHDLDGDGDDELFATVGAGAYTFLVGAWTLDGCHLVRLTVDGIPAAFPVGASASNVVGLRCPEGGGLETVEATYVDEETYEGGFRRYEMVDATLVPGELAPAIFEGDEIPGVAGFVCGGFSLDVLG